MRAANTPLNKLTYFKIAALIGFERVAAARTERVEQKRLVAVMVARLGEGWAGVKASATVEVGSVETHAALDEMGVSNLLLTELSNGEGIRMPSGMLN